MVGEKTTQKLRTLGIRKVADVQQMPLDVVQKVFGKMGDQLWKRANGIDNSPIVVFNERKSISNERTFENDTIDVAKLKTILTAMTENLAYQLRRGKKLTACVSVKIRYSDFNTYSKQMRIPYTNTDHQLIPKVLELYEKLYQRRLLVRLIGVRFSHLVNGNYQINLFEDSENTMALYNAIDRMRGRYGDRSVVRASGLGAKTIGRMKNPFNGEPPTLLAHRKQ